MMTWSSTKRSAVAAHDHAVVQDYDAALLDGGEAAFSQFVGKSVLVDLFDEAVTERIGNCESAPDDPFGHRFQQPGISFIHRHHLHPP